MVYGTQGRWERKGRADMDKAKGESNKKTPRDQALDYLSRRAHTLWEVKKRLKEKGCTEEEIADCVEFLLEYGYVNDQDYCRRYIEYAMEKGRGSLRIRRELAEKGVSGQMIDIALEEMADDDIQKEQAMLQARKALGLSEGESASLGQKELAKVGRKLQGLGYKASVIYSVMDRLR